MSLGSRRHACEESDGGCPLRDINGIGPIELNISAHATEPDIRAFKIDRGALPSPFFLLLFIFAILGASSRRACLNRTIALRQPGEYRRLAAV